MLEPDSFMSKLVHCFFFTSYHQITENDNDLLMFSRMKNLVEEAVPESVDPVVAAGPSLDPGPAEDPEVVRVVVIHAVDQDLNPGLILAQKVGPEVERVQSPDPSRDPSPNPDHQSIFLMFYIISDPFIVTINFKNGETSVSFMHVV